MNSQTRKNLIFFCILGFLFFSPLGDFVREKIASWSAPISRFVLSTPDLTRMNYEENKRKGTYVLENYVQSLDGEKISLTSFKGKVLFINVWDPFNTSSKAELANIQQLYSLYKHDKRIVFLMLTLDTNIEEVKKFIQNEGFTFPVYTTKKIVPEFSTDSVPSTAFINKEGLLTYLTSGAKKWNDKKVKAALDILIEQ